MNAERLIDGARPSAWFCDVPDDLLAQGAFVFGTRPEAIKIASIVRVLSARGSRPRLISTGQQVDLVRQTREALALEVDVDLALMTPDQSPGAFLGRCLTALTAELSICPPTAMFIQGDTTSALAGALCAHYLKIPVVHIEAGLRTNDLANPFPEEAHRQLIARVADYHLCPTPMDRDALLREGVDAARIAVVGNTVIDLLADRERERACSDARAASVLVTTHRRENYDGPLHAIVSAVRRLAQSRADVRFVVPVHPNPRVAPIVRAGLADCSNIDLCAPLPYPEFVAQLASCRLVITDSGGVQEEATYLGTPVVIVRKRTERGLGIAAGAAFLAGTSEDAIVETAADLLRDSARYKTASRRRRLYGDGHAAERIVRLLEGHRVDEFMPEA